MPTTPGPGTNTAFSKRWKLWIVLAVLTVAAALAAGVAWVVGRRPDLPPPTVELNDPDPAVEAALRTAREAVAASPRSGVAWGRLGILLFNYNFLPQSRQCFTQAERLDPREPSWPYYRALTFLSDDLDEAIAGLRRAVELCGDKPDAPRLRLADLLLETGRVDDAEVELRRALEVNPASARAQFGLGRLALERGDLRGSREFLRRAAASPYTEQNAHVLLAQVEQRLGDGRAAEEERRRAEAAPHPASWPDPFLEELQQFRIGKQAGIDRTNELLAENQLDRASEVVEGVVRDYPRAGMGWLLLGEVRLRQQQFPAAEAALRRAVALLPDSVEANFGLGTALFQQQQYGPAAESFRQAVALKPASASTHYNLGQCLVRLGDEPGALGAFQKAVDCRPEFADAHRSLGEVLARRGRRAEAAEHLRLAAQLNPEDAAARKGLDELGKP